MRLFAAAVVGLAVALPVVTASSSAAYAANYLDEAVQALQTQHVYVSPLAQASIDTKSKASLEQQTNGTNIGVVVLPASAKTEAGDIPQFLTDLSTQSGKDTVVVAFGNDLEASSRTVSNASKLANDAEHAHANNTGEALVSFVTEAQHVSAAPAAPDGPGVIGIGVFALVGAAAAATVVTMIRRKRRKGGGMYVSNPEGSFDSLRDQQVPREIREALEALEQFDVKDAAMRQLIAQGAADTVALFQRIKSTEVAQATAQYKGRLTTMRTMLVTYVDIQNNPRYYEPLTDTYLRDGKSAAQQYADGVLKNIKEVARGSLTDFKVDIKMLASANTPDDPTIL